MPIYFITFIPEDLLEEPGAELVFQHQPPQEEEAEQAQEHLQEQQDLRQTWQQAIQTEELDEFEDMAELVEEIIEELGEPKKDKSVRRRFLNWLNDLLHDHNMKKIARTYRRELEEGNELYRTSFTICATTRAEREQRKREKLIHRDHQRQRVKDWMDAYWELQRGLKEAQRLEEEQRYENWMADHGLLVPDSSPEQPKKRMSKWEKRLLRLKELLSH